MIIDSRPRVRCRVRLSDLRCNHFLVFHSFSSVFSSFPCPSSLRVLSSPTCQATASVTGNFFKVSVVEGYHRHHHYHHHHYHHRHHHDYHHRRQRRRYDDMIYIHLPFSVGAEISVKFMFENNEFCKSMSISVCVVCCSFTRYVYSMKNR